MKWNHAAIFKALTATLLFSTSAASIATQISEQDRYDVFAIPLVPFEPATQTQQQALQAAVSAYQQTHDAANLIPLETYLASHPHSPWQASLWLNMAQVKAREGYFSQSIQLFEQSYQAAQQADTQAERAIGIQALGHLLDLHTRFGHEQALSELLAEVSNTNYQVELASISEKIGAARSGLWQIQNTPEAALRCGIAALQTLLSTQPDQQAMIDQLDNVPAGKQGTTLAQLQTWATEAKLPAQAIKVDGHDIIPVPSVMHLKQGHYAAIVSKKNGQYQIQDPTLGNDLWMSRAAIEQESSGHYLVLANNDSDHHWMSLSEQQAQTVLGAGNTRGNDDSPTAPCDPKDGGDSPKNCPKSKGAKPGMPHYAVHSMLVSLNIQDKPVTYTPPVGPSIPLTVTYSQKDAYQPAQFTYSNLGQKWTFDGISYVQDDPQSAGHNVYIYLMGGGVHKFSGYNSGTGMFAAEQRNGAYLVKVSDSPVRYERRMPDGQVYV